MMSLFITAIVSQNFFAKTYGKGVGNDYPRSIIQTTDGGFAIAGYTTSFGAGSNDFLVLKLTSDGSLSWARTFGGTGVDDAHSIIQTQDGGFVVAGYTRNFGAGNSDFLVLKLASNGSLSWARTFGGTGVEEAYSFIQTQDGGFAVVGATTSFSAGNSDFLVLKLTSDGSLSWARTFGGTNYDAPYSIIQTQDGGFAVAGPSWSFGAGNGDLIFLKLDQDGNYPYPDCVEDCSPAVETFTMNTSTPTVGATCSPSTSSPNPTVNTPSLIITDVCPSVELKEENLSDPQPRITCSPVPGGVLFISPGETPIKIYSADGRLTYSGKLEKGENRINLETGVYLWNAGNYKGKVAIR